ncbi:MAG: hypothetical protein EOP24_27655 [Hyphomicrobiales bacterium]|nr:MAG: hypothetical protein EOP24_27655 [Hyphomicrobiales bacterium]
MPIIGWLVQLVIGVALSFAASLIQQALAPKQKEPGVRGSVTMGGDEPLSFIIGRYGSAGHKEYEGTWGSSGDTPNAYHTRVLSFSDLPVRGYHRFFVYGEAVTLAATPHPTRGYPVLEYRRGSKDHLWIKMYDGTQTVADPLLLAAFGADADRPWQGDMIGRGIAYCVFTALVNRELFSGFPEYFAEIDGYDLGDTALNDAPAAFIRKTLHGFSYDGDWVWGLQGLPETRTPAALWDAQIAKCNLPIALAGGGTEQQYRAGAEITVDQQPIEVITELLNSCSGRIAEIGGVYKILVGAPAGPVVSITDDDIITTEGQSLDPFPGLESTFNGVNASYPEPAEKWGMKDAPALRDVDLEADDDDRRLPADVSFPMVYSATQVQRLQLAMHRENRRFRSHSQTMPPEFWEYEVLDTIAWTSERNGYFAKVFLITVMDDLPNGNQFVGSKEQDPADYSWNPGTDQRPYSTAPLVIARPAPQVMTGWQALPAVMQDNDGNDRRPSISIGFDLGLVDVRAVRVQVRLASAVAPMFDGEIPYADLVDADLPVILNGTFLPATDYEVRGIYVPFSGRVTRWSNQDVDGSDGSWLAVTTPDVRLGANDINIELDEIAAEVSARLEWVTAGVRGALEAFKRIGSIIAEQDLDNYNSRELLKREIGVRLDNVEASFVEVIEVALGPGGAIATALSSLYAAMGGNSAQVNVRWQAQAGPTGYSARMALQAAVDDGVFRAATLMLDVPENSALPTRLILDADQTVITTDGGTTVQAMFDADGALIRDLRVGTIRGPSGASFWNLSTGAFRISGGT